MAGGAMGLGIGMFMAALQFRELDYGRGVRYTTKQSLKQDWQSAKGMAKSFASFGVFFSLFDCLLEKVSHQNEMEIMETGFET